MMQINIKSTFRVFTLGLLFGFFSTFTYGQQWGVVKKSNITEQIGNQVFYLHTVAKGNTFYSLTKVYGVTADQIKEANPGLGNDLRLGDIILIPKIGMASPTTSSMRNSYDNYFYHVVKQGETLISIAKIYGVKAEALVEINELRSSAISPGFHLKIPELETESVTQNNTPQQTLTKKLSYLEYTVQPKETLYSIAKRFGIGLETLKYINNLSSNDIYIGQIILIPKVQIDQEAQESKDYIIHLVIPKEGLYGIARNYGISIDQIKTVNPGLTEAISIGQEIKIPRKQNNQGFIQHQVTDRREKLSEIAQEYETSASNLKKLNPDASNKLKRGETINIPVDFIDKAKAVINIDLPEEKELANTAREIYTNNKHRVFNVAFMLPLYLNNVDSLLSIDPQILLAKRQSLLAKRDDFIPFRFLEFYEGAQIAVDSLRKLGMQVNFKVYDVSDNIVQTALLLQNSDLREMDLIISLLFSQNFAMVSDFSKSHHIPLVNALSKRRQIVYENPYVFKMSPKPNALYNRVTDFIGKNMNDFNLIIVLDNPYQLSTEYKLLSELLQQKVNNPVKTVIYSKDGLRGILSQVSRFRKNLIMVMGREEVFAIELFTQLNSVNESLDIKVIGLPDWQNFMQLDVDYTQPFSLRVVSENFVDYSKPEVIRFVNTFHSKYKKIPEIETYSFLGYDATFYFLQALYRFGDNMVENIPDFHLPLLQNQLKFEKQNRGGYENTYWNIYRQENYKYKLER